MWRTVDEASFDHIWVCDQAGRDRPRPLEGPGLPQRAHVRSVDPPGGDRRRHVPGPDRLPGDGEHLPPSGAPGQAGVDGRSTLRGRLEFGIGAGWNAYEHRAFGIDGLDHRIGRLSESLRVDPFPLDAGTNRFRWPVLPAQGRGSLQPEPLQDHPPILDRGRGPQVLRVVARHADVWNYSGLTVDEARAYLPLVDEACIGAGRAPATLLSVLCRPMAPAATR